MEERTAPKLKDVAARAGVSVATASRVINGLNLTRPETAERVQAAISELGFRMHGIGRSLRTSRTHTRRDDPEPRQFGFCRARHRPGICQQGKGLQPLACGKQLRSRGERPCGGSAQDPRDRRSRADGSRPGREPAARRARQRPGALRSDLQFGVVPVPVDRDGRQRGGGAGSRARVRRARASSFWHGRWRILGLRSVGCALSRVHERRSGSGVEPPCLVEVDFSTSQLARKLAVLTSGKAPPTALFCSTDILAISVIGALRDIGIQVPADVSVMGFDGIAVGGMIGPATRHHRPAVATWARQPNSSSTGSRPASTMRRSFPNNLLARAVRLASAPAGRLGSRP